ncbi:hypothetical protein KL86PLE_90697 [uncultured Pleomorphomonas sp.]|uniref:Uncharacterized protein n=1 Tax=uncultured Pleomorphomonas sp. TaxID=442121 RepID=A0A212LR46_9HYPH|nr:hypothetical protein [uncultured Pleomorphomonas sp.]SCM79899.1 hypothetical protein KL86PLE_90697 [uncultured Pleomorphomonas sp.]
MPSWIIRLSNWFAGWRYDIDGWLVRARRNADPDWETVLSHRSDLGFVEEACIAVRTPEIAYEIDRGRLPPA